MTSRTMRGSEATTPGMSAIRLATDKGARFSVTKICGKRVSA